MMFSFFSSIIFICYTNFYGVNVLYSDIVVTKFILQSYFYFNFRINTWGKIKIFPFHQLYVK